MSKFLRKVPSPVQGTSAKILSNSKGTISPLSLSLVQRPGNCAASWLVMMQVGELSRLA